MLRGNAKISTHGPFAPFAFVFSERNTIRGKQKSLDQDPTVLIFFQQDLVTGCRKNWCCHLFESIFTAGETP